MGDDTLQRDCGVEHRRPTLKRRENTGNKASGSTPALSRAWAPTNGSDRSKLYAGTDQRNERGTPFNRVGTAPKKADTRTSIRS